MISSMVGEGNGVCGAICNLGGSGPTLAGRSSALRSVPAALRNRGHAVVFPRLPDLPERTGARAPPRSSRRPVNLLRYLDHYKFYRPTTNSIDTVRVLVECGEPFQWFLSRLRYPYPAAILARFSVWVVFGSPLAGSHAIQPA